MNIRDRDIERFVEMVKLEANKEEDFVEDRVKNTTLYKLLESRYDNVDELLKMAVLKADWIERIKSAMEYEWKRNINVRVYDSRENLPERLLYYLSFQSAYREVYNKCVWRYGKDVLLGLAKEVIGKYPSDTTTIGKYKDVGREWRG